MYPIFELGEILTANVSPALGKYKPEKLRV